MAADQVSLNNIRQAPGDDPRGTRGGPDLPYLRQGAAELGVGDLLDRALGEAGTAGVRAPEPRSPYPGLSSFTESARVGGSPGFLMDGEFQTPREIRLGIRFAL